MACSKCLSFAEIVQGRDTSVRMTHDKLLFAVDLVMVMTGANRDDAGKVLRRLSDELFSSDKLSERNTGGSGNSKTKLVSFEHAIELVMVLPGKIAKETRTMFANILKRYLAGDQSLILEVNANAVSNSPIAQMARDSLGIEKDDPVMVGFKRKREQVELLKLEEEVKAMTQTRILEAAEKLERIRNPSIPSFLDERTRLMLQDSLQNSILNTSFMGGKAAIEGPSPNKPISIGSVAKELGYNPNTSDAKRIGLDLRKRYIKQHGKPPPKHDQLCDGRVTQVNSYNEQDRPLVEEALHAYFKPCENSDGEDTE
jgi:hypothetical protein